MWQTLIKAEPSLANRLSELRKKVIETLLLENGVESSVALKDSEEAFKIFLDERHKVTYFDHVLEVLKKLKKHAKKKNAALLGIFATSAMRTFSNREQIIKKV